MTGRDTTKDKYRLYGWEVSPYSAKVKAYFRYKGIPCKNIVPNIFTLKQSIEPKVGKVIMPVVFGPEDEVLQDSSVIINELEKRYPDKSIIPATPKQQFVSMLLELCGDEWLTMAALHYRWNYPENRTFILNEFGKSALPYFPGFVQRKVASVFAGKLKGYLPILGITEQTQDALEANTHDILQILNRHLESYPYVLGQSPCIGDFSLYGPIYAHLHRDPSPAKLIANYPNVLGWVNRLKDGSAEMNSGFIENDEIPDSLLPLIKLIIEQQFPLLEDSAKAINQWAIENPDKNKLPSRLGDTMLRIGDASASRFNLTYPYWMYQQISDFYHELSSTEKDQVNLLVMGLFETSETVIGFLKAPLKNRVLLKRCRLYLE